MEQVKIYPINNPLSDEFETVIGLLENYSLFDPGKEAIKKIRPSCDKNFISNALQLVSETKLLLQSGSDIFERRIPDVRKEIAILNAQNGVLSIESFNKFSQFIRVVEQVFHFFSTLEREFPTLIESLKPYERKQWVLDKIETVFDKDGIVLSSASERLTEIRGHKQKLLSLLSKQYQKIIQRLAKDGWLTSSVESSRNGRRVLSIHAEYRRSIKGIIHDVSASGRTVFFEPDETIELNNRMSELEQDEKMEIFRILKQLSDDIRIETSSFRAWVKMIAELDVIRCKANLSIEIKGSEPSVSPQSTIQLDRAFHPLLLLHQNSIGKQTIPFDLQLDHTSRIMVISGPNAGGKTMCMKTVGLLQMMFQSGMHISATSTSQLGIFKQILIDIGDNQSIEHELSTYSSRMEYMSYFIQNAHSETLVMIDELGSGTDPQIGAALAEAMVLALSEKGVKGIVTTHYPNIKLLASNYNAFTNASVAFDVEGMKPLYELEIGKPGSSYALLLAERSGIAVSIINKAKELLHSPSLEMETLLTQLKFNESETNRIYKEASEKNNELASLILKYQRLVENELKQETKNDEFLRKKEKYLLRESSDKLKKFYKEFKQAKNKSYIIKKYERYFDERKEQLKKVEEEKEISYSIDIGMAVRMRKGKVTGRVESIEGNKVTVVFGAFKMNCKKQDLIPDDIEVKNQKRD
ncbi:MAG TPA: hypothetical protein PKH65_05675 [Bacteroidia bacterium]|nr:hypothetical protein [Bacteroidia bacterium]HNT80152.1 hypothetical protein [Bacteroidia bacterium]